MIGAAVHDPWTLCGRQMPHCENLFDYVVGGCEQRRGEEATARRATEKQILEDADHLITVWNEGQAKRMAVAGAVFDRAGGQLERRRMSERRSIPPMQYAPPEDGHANHG
jgi:hypothetical protein